MVFVQNQNGKPLMPTNRHGHVRHLLSEGKAKVVCVKPFTIQLTYETENKTQRLVLGIDPGRTNIGVNVVKESGESVFSAKLETRNKKIPKLMKDRKAFRGLHRYQKRRCKRRRRAKAAKTTAKTPAIERVLPGYQKPVVCHDIKNKEARFNNRTRKDGWLTPTARQLLQTHLNLVKKIETILPVTDVVLEMNKFAFMAMDNPHIQKWQYQHGPLFGKGSVENAVCEQQNGVCLLCGKSKIEHYHHLCPRHVNGSNTLPNIVGLCEKCHTLVHTDAKAKAKLLDKKKGTNKKYGALSVLNQIIPYLAEELGKMFPNHCFGTAGYDTKAYRDAYNIPKDHDLDAYCIACSILDAFDTDSIAQKPYLIAQFRRHDRQACIRQMMNRVYILDGKKAATNRQKAFEQKDDSLADANLTKEEISRLTVKKHPAQYKDANRVMPGAVFYYNGQRKVLQANADRYLIGTDGNRYLVSKCKIISKNGGLVYL